MRCWNTFYIAKLIIVNLILNIILNPFGNEAFTYFSNSFRIRPWHIDLNFPFLFPGKPQYGTALPCSAQQNCPSTIPETLHGLQHFTSSSSSSRRPLLHPVTGPHGTSAHTQWSEMAWTRLVVQYSCQWSIQHRATSQTQPAGCR